MTDIPLVTALGLLTLLQLFAATACFSLRNFSRSKVEEICRERGKEGRFKEILEKDDNVLLAAEWALLFAILGGTLVLLALVWPADFASLGTTGKVFAVCELAAYAFAVAGITVLLPWSLSRIVGEWFLVRFWKPLIGLQVVMWPLVSISLRFDRIVHRLAGVPEPTENDADTLTEEIRTVVEEGQREGVLETEATTMIRRVMELRDDDAGSIMTPRTDVFFLTADTPLDEARRQLVEAGHSRIPVIGENQDDVIGVLYAKDLLQHLNRETNGQPVTLADVVREPFYVPETTGIVNLLETMKRDRIHVAIVLDEYGGVAGLVTMEDILEEIVGEIVDEYDEDEEAPIRRLSPTVTELDARVHIDDLNEELGLELPEDGDFDTVGGFVFNQLSRVPEIGDDVVWQNLRLTVLDADKRRIVKLRLEVDESLVPAAEEA